MTEITMDAWVFGLALAGTALTSAALVAFGLAILAAASKPVPSPLAETTAFLLVEHLNDPGDNDRARAQELQEEIGKTAKWTQ